MKIMVGYEGAKTVEGVLEVAHQHAKAFGAHTYIVTSLEQGPELGKNDIDRAESRLERFKALFKADGLPCETEAFVSFESPGEDLVNYAKNKDIDEVIIGIKKKSKVGKLMFGSTAQYVILKSPCPVLSVK